MAMVSHFPSSQLPTSVGRIVLEDPPSEIPPPAFLKELTEAKVFQIHVAIGWPENLFVPTLSLPDFVRLSNSKTLNWNKIFECLLKKYEGMAQENNQTAALFLKQLRSHVGNLGSNK